MLMHNMSKRDELRFANVGNERAVLSCILTSPDLIIDASARLEESDFISSHHRALYSVLLSLVVQGIDKFDFVPTINEATEKGTLELIGGTDYINSLFSTAIDTENFESYIAKLLDSSTKFKLYKETQHIQQKIIANLGFSEDTLPAAELLVQAENGILDVATVAKRADDAVDITLGLRERIDELVLNPVDIVGLPTGIRLLDESINGLTPGSVTVVAARAKHGKSTLLMNMAANIAFNLDKPILYVDTEMLKGEVQTRLLSHRSGVPERLILNGRFAGIPKYIESVDNAFNTLGNNKFYHFYFPAFSIDSLKSLVRKYRSRYGIEALFFDYIKLPESTNLNAVQEHQALGYLTTALKDLAGQLEIPVVTAAQIKREDSQRSRYSDSSVAGSDRILYYCNNLLGLAWKKKEEIADNRSCGTHRLQVLATRGGRPMFDGIDLEYHLPTLTIAQAEHQSVVGQLQEEEPSPF